MIGIKPTVTQIPQAEFFGGSYDLNEHINQHEGNESCVVASNKKRNVTKLRQSPYLVPVISSAYGIYLSKGFRNSSVNTNFKPKHQKNSFSISSELFTDIPDSNSNTDTNASSQAFQKKNLMNLSFA